MDMDTVIANNTAGSSGDVISACVSQITAYGLEARLDPVYPLYCSIYDEGNTTTQIITTDINISPTTEYLTAVNQPTDHWQTSTYMQTMSGTESTTIEGNSAIMFSSEEVTATQQMKPSFATTEQSSMFLTTSGDINDDIETHITNEISTSSPSSTTPQLLGDDTATVSNDLHSPVPDSTMLRDITDYDGS